MKNKYLYNTAFVALYLVYFAIARWIIVTYFYKTSDGYVFLVIYTLIGLFTLTKFTLDKGIELWTTYKKRGTQY
ncbi:hypothetical protein AB5N96_12435 [Chryseomicrobium imtechense]